MSSGKTPGDRIYCDVDWRDGRAVQTGAKSARFPSGASRGAPGQYAVPGWDWDGARLTLRADRYGFRSLFYAIEGTRLRVSGNLLELLAQGADATPDRTARAVFHRLGMFVGDDTPFSAIKTMPPGGVLTWEAGEVRLETPALSITPQQISRDAAVDGMIYHFRTAMERVLEEAEGDIYLPLSGGRDSRHILLELHHLGRPPKRAITFHHGGKVWNGEVRAARAICEALGQGHDVMGYRRPRVADGFRALILTQLLADEHGQMLPLRDYFLSHDGNAMDGIAGDILTNPDDDAEQFYAFAQDGDFAAITRALVEGHGKVISQGGNGAGPVYSPDDDEAALARITECIAAHADAPDPYQMFWLLNRTRREINFVPTGILGSARHVFTPYLDEDFVEFCISLPYAVTRDQKLHDDAIARAYPAVADVPYQDGFPSAPGTSSSLSHKVRSVLMSNKVARGLAPDAPLAMLKRLIGDTGGFRREAFLAYEMHNEVLNRMTPERARGLLDFADRLEAQRPRRLVSDRYDP